MYSKKLLKVKEIQESLPTASELNEKFLIMVFFDVLFPARLLNVRDNLPGWLHAVAIKSCPLSGVLLEAQKLGFGAECASMGEVKHALSLGFPGKIQTILIQKIEYKEGEQK